MPLTHKQFPSNSLMVGSDAVAVLKVTLEEFSVLLETKTAATRMVYVVPGVSDVRCTSGCSLAFTCTMVASGKVNSHIQTERGGGGGLKEREGEEKGGRDR